MELYLCNLCMRTVIEPVCINGHENDYAYMYEKYENFRRWQLMLVP